jgi:iron complex outermembrane receptor protein
MKFLSLFILSFCALSSLAQKISCINDCSCEVKGIIIDAQSSQPIPFSSLQIVGTNTGTTTDENGEFLITGLCTNEFDILVSHIGYKSLTHHHDIYHTGFVVKLAAEDLILESVVIEEKISISGLSTMSESTLQGKDFGDVKTQTLGDALSAITGVSTLKTGQNVVKPIIHGLHSNRILIINDGVRLESQDWGREHAPEIDPSLAEEISLIKGAASIKYGPNAIGGVIVIKGPQMELTSHLHGDVSLKTESNGRAVDGSFSLQKGYDRFVWLVQGASRIQGDLHAPEYELTNTGAREYSSALGLRYHLRKFDVQLKYSLLIQELGILRSSVVGSQEDLARALSNPVPDFTAPFSYDINTPKQETNHHALKLETSYNWAGSQLKLVYGLQVNQRKELDVRRGSNNGVPSIDLELLTHTLEAEWLHPTINGWEGTIGLQGMYQDNNNMPGTNTIPFIPNYNNSRAGLFITESKNIGKTILEIGLRGDIQLASFRGRTSNNSVFINEQQFQSISGLIGFVKHLSTNSTLRMNVATAWRPPNIAELYSFGKHQFTNEYGFYRYENINGQFTTDRVLTADDLKVKNELGYKWIAAYEMKKEKFRMEVGPYLNLIKNYIYNMPRGISNTVRGTFPYFVYMQTDALLAGIDATFLLTHTAHFQSKLTGSFIWAEDITNNDFLFGIPANQLSYKLSRSSKIKQKLAWENSVEVSYTFKQNRAPRVIDAQAFVDNPELDPFTSNNNNFDFTAAPSGYTLLMLSSAITVNQWIFGLRINNLLNTSYRDYTNLLRYFADEPGINIEASIQIKL